MRYNLDYFTKKFKYFPKKIDLAVLGTTQAHFAFDFSSYKLNAANMAVFKNSLLYHKYFLKKYKKRINKGAIVMITVQYPIFLCCKKIKDAMLHIQYAKILFGDDPTLSSRRQIFYRFFPYCYINQNLFEGIIFDNERNKRRNRLRMYEIDKRVQDLLTKGWEVEIHPIKIKGYNSNQRRNEKRHQLNKSFRVVKGTIQYCKANGWRPVLVGLPYSKALNDAVPEKFIKECFYKCVEKLQTDTGILFLDYSAEPDFLSIHNYMDIWFLNEIGREKFTKRVLDDLKREECEGRI